VDRPPVSRAFDNAYEGTPSWETGRTQPAVARLLAEGAFGPNVVDAGCGTGLHAVLLAGQGHDVLGVDLADRAIELARGRALTAGVGARFVVGDALRPDAWSGALSDARSDVPGVLFDSVLDVGLFHVLQPEDRRTYAAALAELVRPGGSGFIVAWSDRNPFGRGPSRIRRRDLRDTFCLATGWRVASIEPTVLESRLDPGWVHAWLARLRHR
jgi:SAM-dependent methyltransferase